MIIHNYLNSTLMAQSLIRVLKKIKKYLFHLKSNHEIGDIFPTCQLIDIDHTTAEIMSQLNTSLECSLLLFKAVTNIVFYCGIICKK